MHFKIISTLFSVVALLTTASADDKELLEPVQPFVKQVVESLDTLPAERKQLLAKVADYAVEKIAKEETANFIFICTHNSRRSHLSQVWFQVAAAYYDVPLVQAYSGGTEATACNVRTVRALRRAGLSVVAATPGDNPVYLVQYSEAYRPLSVYSKVYDAGGNPTTNFAAMMCCSDADDKCPLVEGADGRFALHYLDPKEADDTPQEAERYDERNLQIAREMFYIMSQVAKRLDET